MNEKVKYVEFSKNNSLTNEEIPERRKNMENYVKRDELLKELEIQDLKVKNLETKIDGKFELVLEKLDRINEKTSDTDRKLNWIITGIILAIVTPIITQLIINSLGL